jgi:hypothetical protein
MADSAEAGWGGVAELGIPIVGGIAKAIEGALAAKRAKKAGKLKAKEMRRETQADLLSNAEQREAEMEEHSMGSSERKARRSARSKQGTADTIRRAINI